MSVTDGTLERALRAVRGALPHGQLLTPQIWQRRHKAIVAVLWLHVAAVDVFGVARGYGLGHSSVEASLVAVFAVPAISPALGRRARSAAAVLGLITASAALVHLSGGVVEMHFHFFVMIGVITLYQDWLPFGLALGYVVLHHGVLGMLRPQEVYNHPAAWHAPWKWALIHGGSCSPPAWPTWPPGGSASPRRPRSAGWSAACRGWPAPMGSPASPTGGCGTRSCRASWAGPADGDAAVRGHDRPGPLQALQRPVRPSGW